MKKRQAKNITTDRKYVNILGINILSTSMESLLVGITQKITDSTQFSILTPNPELVLASTKNKSLAEALNSATFSVPDGIALLAAERFTSKTHQISGVFRFIKIFYIWLKYFYIYTFNREKLKSTLTLTKGRGLFVRLVEMAEKNDWKIFLLGGSDQEAVLTAEHLISLYPSILVSTSQGPKLNKNGEPDTKTDKKIQSDVVTRINMLNPDLLFVAFGNPKQEIWIHKNLPKLNVGGAMAVGGTFRYLAGITPLPPKWMENLSLEWLWRLVTEPNRFIRIWNAVIVFPLRVLLVKLKQSF